MTPSAAPKFREKKQGLAPLELAVLVLFFLSGASALVYEVVWTRDLTNVFGGSAFAIATVLAAFMAGLALGSTLFGRSIDRRGHPLMIYGLLEAGIAVWALLLPVLLGLLDQFYASVYRSLDPGFYTLSMIRFVLSFFLLLVPTTLMGGTLPVLGKLLLRNWGGLGQRAGLLYGTNTLGAVVGVALGGFVLLPTLGLRGSTLLAVALNLLVALAAVVLARREGFKPPAPAPTSDETTPESGAVSPRLRRAVLLVYAASGFAALAYEVAWTKTLSMILGTTTYAFTSMLTTFLLGLSLGSFVFGRLADRYGRPMVLLATVQAGIPLIALLTIPLIGQLPQMFVDAFAGLEDSWIKLEMYRILLAASTMFIPTVLMGGTFPLVTRVFVQRGKTGSNLGTLYAANTVGAILGSFLAGFVLVPWLGRQNTILAASLVNVAAALLLLGALRWRTVPTGFRWGLAAIVALLVPAWFFGVKPWSPKIMASGAYIYARNMAQEPSIEAAMAGSQLLFYDEATEATVSVWQGQQVTSLRTNGKVEASSHGDMITQKLISHLPLLYHRNEPKSALMIGLASGISVGALLTHPLEEVETVELMPSMAQAARYFDSYNGRCLDDPRHRLILNDGRNHLRLSKRTYDVIVSEPSNPWISGVGSLFTREFFEITKQRLEAEGVVCQWVQTYQMQENDLRTVLATFLDAYPHLHLWQGAPGDLIVVASKSSLELDLDQIDRAVAGKPGADIGALEILPVAQLLSYFVTDRAGMEAYVGSWDDRVTDDNLYLEYSIPRHMFETTGLVNVLSFQDVQRSVVPYLVRAGTAIGTADSTLADSIDRYRVAHGIALRAFFYAQFPSGASTQADAMEHALRIAPEEYLSRHLRSRDLNEQAIQSLLKNDADAARPGFARAARMGSRGERAIALNNLGTIAFQIGDFDSALVYWERCLTLEPHYPTVNFNLAVLAGREGRFADAVPFLKETVRFDPENAVAHNNLAYYMVVTGDDLEAAEAAARTAVEIESDPIRLDTLGFVLLKQEKWEEAVNILGGILEDDPAAWESMLHLGMAHAGRGHIEKAKIAFETVMQKSGDQDLARQARDQLQGLQDPRS